MNVNVSVAGLNGRGRRNRMEDKKIYHYREADSCLSCEHAGVNLHCSFLRGDFQVVQVDSEHVCDAFEQIKEDNP